jgi:hypothetical protein
LKPIRISTALLKRKYRWWAEKLSMTTHANKQEAQFFHTHALQTNHYPIRKCEWNTRSSPRLNYLMEKRKPYYSIILPLVSTTTWSKKEEEI